MIIRVLDNQLGCQQKRVVMLREKGEGPEFYISKVTRGVRVCLHVLEKWTNHQIFRGDRRNCWTLISSALRGKRDGRLENFIIF